MKCDHLYSRQIDQPYPRHCIKCGEVEGTDKQAPTGGITKPPRRMTFTDRLLLKLLRWMS